MLTYSRCFPGSPQPCSFGNKGANVGKVCTWRVCNRSASIEDVSACAGDAYIGGTYGKDVCIRRTCIKAFCIDNAYIGGLGTVKRLRIHLQ